jgi:hypothetical protein
MYVKNTIEELEDRIEEVARLVDDLDVKCTDMQIDIDYLQKTCETLDDENDNLWTIIYRIADVLDLEAKLLDPNADV